jgi:hypothetical protein
MFGGRGAGYGQPSSNGQRSHESPTPQRPFQVRKEDYEQIPLHRVSLLLLFGLYSNHTHMLLSHITTSLSSLSTEDLFG